MFDKPLNELRLADLSAFLDQEIPEGPSLDYKRELTADLADTACAFANTVGGYIIIGVQEGREDLPDTSNIPGLDPRRKPRSSVENRITSRTRPTIVPEVSAPLELEDGSGKIVLVVYVKESIDAPHEVMGTSPKILVRRGTKNESIGLNDVERLIYRRNEALQANRDTLPINYHDGKMGSLRTQGPLSVSAVAIRPYRTPSFKFDLDAGLDAKIAEIANEHGLGPLNEDVRPTPYGLALDFRIDVPSESLYERRIEVHENGLIRCTQVLFNSGPESFTASEESEIVWNVDFGLVVRVFVNMMRFAGRTYGLKYPRMEMEARFGLHGGHEHALQLPHNLQDYMNWRTAIIPNGSELPLEKTVLLETGEEGGIVDEEALTLSLARTVSRWFGASFPDARLQEYFATALYESEQETRTPMGFEP